MLFFLIQNPCRIHIFANPLYLYHRHSLKNNAVVGKITDKIIRGFRYNNFSIGCYRFEPLSHVNGFPYHGIIHMFTRSYIPRKRIAGGDADTYIYGAETLFYQCIIEPLDFQLNLHSAFYGPYRIILVRIRNTEYGHESVTQKFVEHASEFEYARNDAFKIPVEYLHDILDIILFNHAGEFGNISKQYSNVLDIASKLVESFIGNQMFGKPPGEITAQIYSLFLKGYDLLVGFYK